MAERSKMLPLALGLGFLLMLPMFFMDWSNEGEYPQLEKAGRVVRYLSAPRQLKRSSFSAIYPQGKPSDFVQWMFSEIGAAEWPPSEWELQDGEERRAIKAIGIPLIPPGVGIYPRLKKEEAQQIVVTADDGQGLIRIDGYITPLQPPVFTRQWPFTRPPTT